MIHVLTVHWQSDQWIDIQLQALERHISRPYRVYAFLNGIDVEPHRQKFFYCSDEDIKSHAVKLNLLADMACMAAESPDDWLMFIDGDAFPVGDVVEFVEQRLGTYSLVAVRRDEHMGDLQPHPCFCVTTAGFWKRIRGDWKRGYKWKTREGDLVTDVGGNLLGRLIEAGSEWYPITRSNVVNLHPLMFGIYGDIVYHHGAGFRTPISRMDKTHLFKGLKLFRKLSYFANKGSMDRLREKNIELSHEVFEEIRSNKDFYKRFLGANS